MNFMSLRVIKLIAVAILAQSNVLTVLLDYINLFVT